MAARPATRAARDRSGEAPVRTPVRDLTRGATSYRIDWDVRPAYDFVFSLSAETGETDDLPAEDRAWLKTARNTLPNSVGDADRQLFDSDICVSAAVLLIDRPEVRTAREFIDALAEATPGEVIRGVLEYSSPESGVRRLILAPSYFSRPYNFVMSAGDWRLFGYPVSDDALEAIDPLAAPSAVVRLHRALGDSTRLKILKLLAGHDLYLTEIAQQLDLSKPTIKHHLALLRAAGLVTITESGSVVYYTLRRNRLDDASTDIKRFLIG